MGNTLRAEALQNFSWRIAIHIPSRGVRYRSLPARDRRPRAPRLRTVPGRIQCAETPPKTKHFKLPEQDAVANDPSAGVLLIRAPAVQRRWNRSICRIDRAPPMPVRGNLSPAFFREAQRLLPCLLPTVPRVGSLMKLTAPGIKTPVPGSVETRQLGPCRRWPRGWRLRILQSVWPGSRLFPFRTVVRYTHNALWLIAMLRLRIE